MSNNITIPGRIMYPHVFTPHKFKNDRSDKDPVYMATIVVNPQDPMVQKVLEMEQTLINTELDGVVPTPQNRVFKQAPQNNPNIQGCWIITAKSSMTQKPTVIDKNGQPIVDPNQLSDGDWCFFNIALFSYNQMGNKGVSASLNGVLFDRKGEARLGLAGPPSIEEMFSQQLASAPQSPHF